MADTAILRSDSFEHQCTRHNLQPEDKWETERHGTREDMDWAVRESLTTAASHTSLSGPASVAITVLGDLERKIADSRWILELKEDWDQEGAGPYHEATWNRAVDFLRMQARAILEEYGLILSTPDILPGPNGSVDIHWESQKFEFLLNVPQDPAQPATFYGDDRGMVRARGSIDLQRSNLGLVLWLVGT